MKFGNLYADAEFARSTDRATFVRRLSNHDLKGVDDKEAFLSEVYDRLNKPVEVAESGEAANAPPRKGRQKNTSQG